MAYSRAEPRYRKVTDPEDAHVGIINTCAFIQDAVKENIDAILDLELLKERGVLERIVVVGCIVNRRLCTSFILVRTPAPHRIQNFFCLYYQIGRASCRERV